ncbi:MAG: carbamoyltransferase [Candidatus Gygaella obscura]|nr:carbamoyltransferase [Candidatus Gygaella obscura]
MSMNILGLSCFYHDSAAALVKDGDIVCAAQEERFTRKKHDFNFPSNAVDYCLKENNSSINDIDYVVFYDKPFVKFERILETYLMYVPSGILQFIQAMPLWLKQKLWISELIKKELGYKKKILFSSHHESHAASAFYPSPFKKSAFLTMDGVGEWDTASFGTGSGNKLDIAYTLKFPHSLGLLYSTFTYFCGFKVNSGEYKLMGLAPYGEPKYVDVIKDNLIDLKQDGSFKLNMRYFGFCNSLTMTNKKFNKLFGLKPRKPETKISQEYMDMAASIQKVTEGIMIGMANFVYSQTKEDNLCLAGGVALNCVGNGRLLRETPFRNIWIQPASGDAGGALGAALLIWYKYLNNDRIANENNDFQKSSLLGPQYTDEQIEKYLKENNIPYEKLTCSELPGYIADRIIEGNVIGWFQGRMEFGPRALGARSILGDSRSPDMQKRMNLKIKLRESFRPFAPSVLFDKTNEWFDIEKESPYMLLVAPIKKEKQIDIFNEQRINKGFDSLKEVRSEIPAVIHVDYTARIQTVKKEDHPLYYDLIDAFYKKTGCPVLINTSFNVRGEPLVCTPSDAFMCFMRTEMDYLVMGSFVLNKKDQKPIKKDINWQKVFELD